MLMVTEMNGRNKVHSAISVLLVAQTYGALTTFKSWSMSHADVYRPCL